VCTEAVAVVRAVGADWYVEIVSNNSIRHIPWSEQWRPFLDHYSRGYSLLECDTMYSSKRGTHWFHLEDTM
jgi:hypothetical protein